MKFVVPPHFVNSKFNKILELYKKKEQMKAILNQGYDW